MENNTKEPAVQNTVTWRKIHCQSTSTYFRPRYRIPGSKVIGSYLKTVRREEDMKQYLNPYDV